MTSRDELYQKFGVTAEAAQLFEADLGSIMLSVNGLKHDWHIAPDRSDAQKLYEKMGKLTLGNLLRQTCQDVSFDDNTFCIFDAALDARNKLFHGFFERHNFKIQTDEGRAIMMADLEQLHDKLINAWRIASAISAHLLVKLIAEVAETESKRAPEAP